MPSCLARYRLKFFVVNNHLTDGISFNLQSCWCLSKLCCHHGHSSKYTEGVAHIKNDDVTVSNGVNLCHPKFWHATDHTVWGSTVFQDLLCLQNPCRYLSEICGGVCFQLVANLLKRPCSDKLRWVLMRMVIIWHVYICVTFWG